MQFHEILHHGEVFLGSFRARRTNFFRFDLSSLKRQNKAVKITNRKKVLKSSTSQNDSDFKLKFNKNYENYKILVPQDEQHIITSSVSGLKRDLHSKFYTEQIVKEEQNPRKILHFLC